MPPRRNTSKAKAQADRVPTPSPTPTALIAPKDTMTKKRLSINKELFIEEVRKYEYLYDLKHQFYKDTLMKERRWFAIGTMFHITSIEAYNVWRAIRDRYRKEKNKVHTMKSGAGADEIVTPKWHLYPVLDSFLRATMEPRQTCTNGDSVSEPGGGDEESMSIGDSAMADFLLKSLSTETEEILSDEDDDDNCTLSQLKEKSDTSSVNPALIKRSHLDASTSNSSSSVTSAKNESDTLDFYPLKKSEPKKRKKSDIDETFHKMLDISEKTLMSQLSVSTQQVEKDEVFHYFSSLMGRFRNLEKKKQREARHKIEELFYLLED